MLQIKKYIYIIIISFIVGAGCAYYYLVRTDVFNITERIAEYNRIVEEYKVGESKLKGIITQLQSDIGSATAIAKRAEEEKRRILEINIRLSKQITELQFNNQRAIESSERIDQSTDRIDGVIQQVIERGATGN